MRKEKIIFYFNVRVVSNAQSDVTVMRIKPVIFSDLYYYIKSNALFDIELLNLVELFRSKIFTNILKNIISYIIDILSSFGYFIFQI